MSGKQQRWLSKSGPDYAQATETSIYITRTGPDLTTCQPHTEGEEGRPEEEERETGHGMLRARRGQGHTAGVW